MSESSPPAPDRDPTGSDFDVPPESRTGTWQQMKTAEDWWAIWCAALLLVVCFTAVWLTLPADWAADSEDGRAVITSPLKGWLTKPGKWTQNPLEAFYRPPTRADAGT